MWRRHEHRGWVCLCCGYRALWQAARDVHERRAMRGLGCNESSKTPNSNSTAEPAA